MDKNNNRYQNVKPTRYNQPYSQNSQIFYPPMPPPNPVPYAPIPVKIPTPYSEGECPFPSIPFSIPLPRPVFLSNHPNHPIRPLKTEESRSKYENPNSFYKSVFGINNKYIEDYLSMKLEDFYDVVFSDLIIILLPTQKKEIFTKEMAKEMKEDDEVSDRYLKMLYNIIKCCGFTVDSNGDTVIHSRFYNAFNSIERWKEIKNVLKRAKESFTFIYGSDTNYNKSIDHYLEHVDSKIQAAKGIFGGNR